MLTGLLETLDKKTNIEIYVLKNSCVFNMVLLINAAETPVKKFININFALKI